MTAGRARPSVRPEPARDRYGRYLLPDPVTGKQRSFTRVTTMAKLSDTTALNKWKLRTALKGTAKERHLLDVIATTDDKSELDALAEAALQAGGANDGSDAGTDLHSLTELVDLGLLRLEDVPEGQRGDVRAYVFALAAAGIEILPEYIERIIINQTVDTAGTFDRLVRVPDGRLLVADLKTGRDLSFGWGDIAIQLAIYAQANGMYDDQTGTYDPMPGVDKETALVFHLPVGKEQCSIWEVDIASGWDAAQLAHRVRTWRSRRDLATSLDPDALKAGAELLVAISQAGSAGDLTDLWRGASAGHWTQRHTNAATARKAELISTGNRGI